MAVELFAVVCTTCQSRLKVRDRAVIGQILACPKCQAMVLVQPPPGWVDPSPADAAEAAPVHSPAADPVKWPPSAERPAKRAPATPSSPSRQVEASFEDVAALLARPATEPAPPPLPAEAAPAGTQPLAPPTGEWISPETARLKQRLLLGGLAAMVVLAVVLGVWSQLGGSGGDSTDVAQAGAGVETEPVDEPPSRAASETDQSPMSPVSPVDVKDDGQKKLPDVPGPSKPAVDLPDGDMPPVGPKPPLEPMPPPNPPQDPLDTEPRPLDNFSLDNTRKKFGDLIEETPFEKQPAGEPAAPVTPPVVDDASEPEPEAAIETPLPRPAPRKVDIAKRMSDRLEAIEIKDMALAEFLQFVTDMTAVPITLDPAALAAIRVTPESKVNVSLQKSNVASMLTEALRPLNLAFVPGDTQVVVVPTASATGELRELKFDVRDLAADEAATRALGDLTMQLIDPSSWKSAGGVGDIAVASGELTITQSPENLVGAMILLDKLRAAQKLPAKSNLPAAAVSLVPRALAADALLDKPVTLNYVPPTRLGKVCERVKSTTGLRILIDWTSLADMEWTPEGEVKAGVANQPLRAFLDRLTRRMEISYRVLDEKTVQLVSQAALDDRPDVEVFPLPAPPTEGGAALVEKLTAALGKDFLPGSNAQVIYHAPSRSIIARLPQPLIRKLAPAIPKG